MIKLDSSTYFDTAYDNHIRVGELLTAQILPDARRRLLEAAVQHRSQAAIACMRSDAGPLIMRRVFDLLNLAMHEEGMVACLRTWLDHPAMIDAWADVAKRDPNNFIEAFDGRVLESYRAAGLDVGDVPLVSVAMGALAAVGIRPREGWSLGPSSDKVTP